VAGGVDVAARKKMTVAVGAASRILLRSSAAVKCCQELKGNEKEL